MPVGGVGIARHFSRAHARDVYRFNLVTIAAFYRFAPVDDVSAFVRAVRAVCESGDVYGSVLIAAEGVNGTIAGSAAGVAAVLDRLRETPGLSALRVQFSSSTSVPFHRLKVEHKREIVTFRQPGTNPLARVGAYVKPADWNAVLADDDVVVIDARNNFEVELGTFTGAVNPRTTTFTEFAAFCDAHLDPVRTPRVAMFCTGGIRCEKATSYLLDKGFNDVVHLDGGILAYLAQVPAEASRFEGECFVFDQRVSLVHGLVPGSARLCHACYGAVDEAAVSSSVYEQGVSCPRCHGTASAAQLASRRERQKQVVLAEQQQRKHIGEVMPRRAQHG